VAVERRLTPTDSFEHRRMVILVSPGGHSRGWVHSVGYVAGSGEL